MSFIMKKDLRKSSSKHAKANINVCFLEVINQSTGLLMPTLFTLLAFPWLSSLNMYALLHNLT